jgi:hypothetical protein
MPSHQMIPRSIMSKPQTKGRHAAPGRPVGRRLATAAAALAAGAIPLASAAAASAATPQPHLPDLGLASTIPTLALPGSDGSSALGLPVVQQLPVGSVVGRITQRTAGLTPLPLAAMMPQLMPTTANPMQIAPNALREGALGRLSTGFAPQANELTGGLVGQAAPLVSQLHRSGVPTVGDLTARVSQTRLPMVGDVGGLTSSLPVTAMLGSDSPVTGTLQNLGRL